MNINPEDAQLSVAELRDSLEEVVDQVSANTTRAYITKDGKPIATVVSMFEIKLLDTLEERVDIAAYEEAVANDDDTSIPLSDFLEKHPVGDSLGDPTSSLPRTSP